MNVDLNVNRLRPMRILKGMRWILMIKGSETKEGKYSPRSVNVIFFFYMEGKHIRVNMRDYLLMSRH